MIPTTFPDSLSLDFWNAMLSLSISALLVSVLIKFAIRYVFGCSAASNVRCEKSLCGTLVAGAFWVSHAHTAVNTGQALWIRLVIFHTFNACILACFLPSLHFEFRFVVSLQFLSQLFELRTIGSDSISAGPGGFPCIRSSPLAFMHVLYPPQYVVLFHAFNACLVASYICFTLTSTLRHILIFMSLTAA